MPRPAGVHHCHRPVHQLEQRPVRVPIHDDLGAREGFMQLGGSWMPELVPVCHYDRKPVELALGSTIARDAVASVKFRKCTSESGVSRGTRMSVRRSLSPTSAARSMRLRLVPCAIAATVPIQQGQITIPAVFADPDAGSAPRSESSNTRTLGHSPPVACFSARSSAMPHSSASKRPPWLGPRD